MEPAVNEIYHELKYVFDPETGVNIVDLGLIEKIETTGDGIVRIEMVFATDDSDIIKQICSGVVYAVSLVDGVKEVVITKAEKKDWTPGRMNEQVKRDLIGT